MKKYNLYVKTPKNKSRIAFGFMEVSGDGTHLTVKVTPKHGDLNLRRVYISELELDFKRFFEILDFEVIKSKSGR